MKILVSLPVIFLILSISIISPAQGGCLVDSDWPNAPCYDLPGHTIDKKTLQQQWAPYYQYKGSNWMEMMKSQMIDAIKNGTIKDWIGHNDATSNAWTYYSLNDQVPFFISPGSQNYTRPGPIMPPLQQLKSGTPLEDTQCMNGFTLWLKQDGTPVCIKKQDSSVLLKRGFLLDDSYTWFALGEAKRFVNSSPTFASGGIKNSLKLDVISIEQSFPPIVLIQATFDNSNPGYGDKSLLNVQPQLTHHVMAITISDTNRVTLAIIDKQWDEINQKFIKY